MITDRIFETRSKSVRFSITILASEAHFRSYIVCSGMDTPIDRFENTLKWNLYETGTFFHWKCCFLQQHLQKIDNTSSSFMAIAKE